MSVTLKRITDNGIDKPLRIGAANRFLDKCDFDPEGTRALNIEASRALAAAASSRSIFLIYISADYVFPGTKGDAPYEVTHAPKPPNLYGETKHDGEKAVLGECEKAGKEGWAVVLRVPVLYGHAESPTESAVNVLMDAVWKAQEKGAAINMDHWALRYPTNTEDVGRVCQGTSSSKSQPFPNLYFGFTIHFNITLTCSAPLLIPAADVATKYIGTSDKASLPSILQFSSEDKFTKYEIAQLFAEIMGLSPANIHPNTEGNDPNVTVQRPYDCHLSTKLLKDIGIAVLTQDFTAWWRRECRAFRR